jgi:CelD/BcsL family acetyltransferase involved in cellulose biosynthesis
MTGSGLKSTITPVLSLPAEIVETWRRIQRSHTHLHSAFFSYEYAYAVATVRPDVYVCLIEKNGEVAGLLPFQFETPIHRRLGAAERVGGELTDYFGLIAEPSLQIKPEQLLRLAGLNHFYFTHLNEPQLRHGLEAERAEVGLLIDVGGTPGDYWDRLRAQDKKFVQDTERRARKLEADYGPLRFQLDDPDTSSALEHLIDQKRQQYRTTNVDDSLKLMWRRALLRRLTQSDLRIFRAKLSTLFAGDTWVASQLSLRGVGVLHNWFPVYNRCLSHYAPGRLLLKHIACAAPAEGIFTIDRGVGDTQAKRDFATREQLLYRGVWHRPNIQSLIYRAACSLSWRLAGFREGVSAART